MSIDQKYYSGGGIGNFNFSVAIYPAGGDALLLIAPVEAVKGLNDGSTSVIRHRNDGFSSTSLRPYAGLTTPDPVTLEGTCFAFMSDVKELQLWREQVKETIGHGIGGEYRDVVIMPNKRNEFDTDIAPLSGETYAKIRLINCLATKLTISDFDHNNPSVLNWSLELTFEEMKVE